jgi:hypothetical protein
MLNLLFFRQAYRVCQELAFRIRQYAISDNKGSQTAWKSILQMDAQTA